jgi:hypothetical protein
MQYEEGADGWLGEVGEVKKFAGRELEGTSEPSSPSMGAPNAGNEASNKTDSEDVSLLMKDDGHSEMEAGSKIEKQVDRDCFAGVR